MTTYKTAVIDGKKFNLVPVEEVQEQDKEEKQVEKWEPSGGNYFISGHGKVCFENSTQPYMLHGNEFSTEEYAEKCRDERYQMHMLQKLREERCPDYEPDWSDRDENKHFIFFDHNTCSYRRGSYGLWQNTSCIYFPKDTAEQIVEELNNGTIDLKYNQ